MFSLDSNTGQDGLGDMNPHTLELPEEAKEPFRQAIQLLERMFPRDVDGRTAFVFGGGTCLAAQWRHRRSTDIDLKAGPDMHLDEYMDGAMLGEELRQEARRVGLEVEAWRSASQVILNTADGNKVDIFASEPELDREPEEHMIEDTRVRVASVAEILYGKINGRGHRAPVRDVFDMAVATRRAQTQLQRAVDAVSAKQLERTLSYLDVNRRKLEDEARDDRELAGVAQRYGHLVEGVWAHGYAALITSRTTHLEIRADLRHGARWIGTSANGARTEGPVCTSWDELRTAGEPWRVAERLERPHPHRIAAVEKMLAGEDAEPWVLRDEPVRVPQGEEMDRALRALPAKPRIDFDTQGRVYLQAIRTRRTEDGGLERHAELEDVAPDAASAAARAEALGMGDAREIQVGIEHALARARAKGRG